MNFSFNNIDAKILLPKVATIIHLEIEKEFECLLNEFKIKNHLLSYTSSQDEKFIPSITVWYSYKLNVKLPSDLLYGFYQHEGKSTYKVRDIEQSWRDLMLSKIL